MRLPNLPAFVCAVARKKLPIKIELTSSVKNVFYLSDNPCHFFKVLINE